MRISSSPKNAAAVQDVGVSRGNTTGWKVYEEPNDGFPLRFCTL
jgi:hypothetical protein